MADQPPQKYATHTRYDPPFHFFVIPVFAITVLLTLWTLIQNVIQGTAGFLAVWTVIVALAALVAAFKIRLYALKVQDRLIRLEERMRLALALPDSLRARIDELSEAQLVALRFCSDPELPLLANKAMAEKLPPAEIKKAIVVWRPDYFRV